MTPCGLPPRRHTLVYLTMSDILPLARLATTDRGPLYRARRCALCIPPFVPRDSPTSGHALDTSYSALCAIRRPFPRCSHRVLIVHPPLLAAVLGILQLNGKITLPSCSAGGDVLRPMASIHAFDFLIHYRGPSACTFTSLQTQNPVSCDVRNAGAYPRSIPAMPNSDPLEFTPSKISPLMDTFFSFSDFLPFSWQRRVIIWQSPTDTRHRGALLWRH